MKQSSYLIKPASSLCNMNCKYCFYSNVSNQREVYSKGIMKKDTAKILIEKALDDAADITFAFQGGEPTLADLDFFKYFVDCVEKKKTNQVIHFVIQTNGYCLNKEWIDFLKKHHFLVGVSLDGIETIHDQLRLKTNQHTFFDILENIKQLQKEKVDYNILTVVTSQMVPYAKDVYQFYKQQGFQHVQFIPCLPELDSSTNDYCLKPKQFYDFYHQIFPLWYEDLQHGKYMSISFFEDLLMISHGRYPRTCGMLGQCQLQFIIEADGSVYPCDFYALDQYGLGNITSHSLEQLRHANQGKQFLQETKRYSKLCSQCKFKKICHGQCKRMNIVYFDDDYCAYRDFLNETFEKFHYIQ